MVQAAALDEDVNVPASQLEHDVAASEEKVPGGQLVQVETPNWPAPQVDVIGTNRIASMANVR